MTTDLKRIPVYVTEELHRATKVLAFETDRTMSDLVREALIEYLRQYGAVPEEVLKKNEAIGNGGARDDSRDK